jgi:hypothetical protein
MQRSPNSQLSINTDVSLDFSVSKVFGIHVQLVTMEIKRVKRILSALVNAQEGFIVHLQVLTALHAHA